MRSITVTKYPGPVRSPESRVHYRHTPGTKLPHHSIGSKDSSTRAHTQNTPGHAIKTIRSSVSSGKVKPKSKRKEKEKRSPLHYVTWAKTREKAKRKHFFVALLVAGSVSPVICGPRSPLAPPVFLLLQSSPAIPYTPGVPWHGVVRLCARRGCPPSPLLLLSTRVPLCHVGLDNGSPLIRSRSGGGSQWIQSLTMISLPCRIGR
jgi:hypothetical protein